MFERGSMKQAAGLAVLGVAIALAGSARAAPPVRVMSLNACTDQLVMMLLPPDRISSVTYLAEGAAVTPALAKEAAALRINHGLSEEILAQKPDLVIAGPFTTPAARKLAKQAGMALLVVDYAESFDDIRRTTRQVAKAVGEEARGEALLQHMDIALSELERTKPGVSIKAVAWDGSGRVPGAHSLFNEILEAAGGVNLGAQAGRSMGTVDLEQLLALKAQPDVLLYAVAGKAQPSLQTAAVQHPVLAHAYAHRRLAIPEYSCGTPQAADQALALRQAMRRALGARP